MSLTDLSEVAQSICNATGYDYIGRVGEGSFKETFHVRTSTGTSAALKVLRQNSAIERIRREVEAMARCSHPNIGRLYSVEVFPYKGENFLYMTEEFLEGGTLTNRLAMGNLQVAEVVALGEPLISAVSQIASLDLVHRDLKPDNIMFRSDGTTPVIVDFGVVRDLTQASLTHDWLLRGPGTPYYAALEQLENKKELIDWRTDQFALGVLLTECALSYHPYSQPGDDKDDVVQRVATRQVPSARFLADTKNLGLIALEKMVAMWPVLRYRTPEELLQAWQSQGAL